MAGDLLMSISQDERERAVFRSRRMYQTDMQSNLATVWDRGKEEGREERNFEIARNLMQMGLSPKQIKEAMGLSLEEVTHLRAENG